MGDLVEPIPQVAVGDLANVAEKCLAARGDATLMLLSCDNWVDLVREIGFTAFHRFMEGAIAIASALVPGQSTILRLESDQFGIVTSGLSNREGRSLAVRIQVQISSQAKRKGINPQMSVAVGHLLPGRATALEVIARAKEMLVQSKTHGAMVSVSSAPLSDPWDSRPKEDVGPTSMAPAPSFPLRVLPIARVDTRESVAFELETQGAADIRDLTTALEIGRTLSDGLNIHVNIPTAWLTPGMCQEVLKRLNTTHPTPVQICVELSARGLGTEQVDFLSFVKRVRTLGCLVALDDVGFGYTALEKVVEIQPDLIKLDQAVLESMREGKGRSMVRMIEMLQLSTPLMVGMGVHNERDEELMQVAGVKFVQGALYGPPEGGLVP